MPRNLYVRSLMSGCSLCMRPSLVMLVGSWMSSGSLLLYVMPSVFRLILMLVPLGLKIMYFVFDTFTAMRLVLNQMASFCISLLTLFISVGRSESESSPAVSSANSSVSRSVARWRSFIKHRKRMGPNILPWSTEMSIGLVVELVPSISTYYCLLSR